MRNEPRENGAAFVQQGMVDTGRSVQLRTISRFLKDESGATAIEYGLIAAGIAIAIISAVKGVGSALSSKFTVISTSLK